MKLFRFFFQITFLCLVLFACQVKDVKNTDHHVNKISELVSLLPDPPSSFRSAPLWDWNEKINKEDIAFQMKKFKEGGLGGVFVHPRPGLITEYLSEEWNQLFDYTVKIAKELDMKVWIYDENSYPSGFAGGHVPARFPDSYQNGTGLGVKITTNLADTSNLQVEAILYKSDSASPTFSTFSTSSTIPIRSAIGISLRSTSTTSTQYYIFYRTYPQPSYWTGGYPYVDLLYPGVTDTFIKITMEGYEKFNKQDFGSNLPGVFTDEPNLPAALGPGSLIRWTPDLFDRFHERWGYRLEPNLGCFLEETGNWRKVRHDYHELMLELFLDRWAVPWFEYTQSNNLIWTGHYWEHGWPYPGDGIDELAFYMYHQQPGVDMLGRSYCDDGLCGQFGNTRAIRELASAANQRGWTRRFSETYGGAGWQISFEELKRLADWQGVLGVNFVNQHLSYFSMVGVRKFDYPPSFSYQEPWWDNYKLMGDYIGRISLATAAGDQINDVLVLQPNTSAWLYYPEKKGDNRIFAVSKSFKSFVQNLEESHFEYDLGSEQVMKRFGKINADGLNILKRTYSKLVIPAAMTNLDAVTLELIENFVKAGFPVYSLSDSLDYVDGATSTRIKDFAAAYRSNWIQISNQEETKINEIFSRPGFSINQKNADQGQLFHQRRILKDGQLLFLVNSSSNETAEASIQIQCKDLIEVDLLNGKIKSYPFESEGSTISFQVELPVADSRLLLIPNKKGLIASDNSTITASTISTTSTTSTTLTPSTTSTPSTPLSPNILLIDYLDLETKDFKLEDTYFMNAMYKLFEWSKLPTGNPWQHKIQYKQRYVEMDNFDETTWFKATYRFFVSDLCSSEVLQKIQLVVERSECWQVSVNGQGVQPESDKWWLDRHFHIFNTRGTIQSGWNVIELSAPRMSVYAEIMPVYLLGDFGLISSEKGFSITQSGTPGNGSWKDAGMPFYGDKISYSQEFDLSQKEGAYILNLGEWKGTVAEVWVNGSKAGIIGWEPFNLDITDYIQTGLNKVEVIITGSLKNTMGYHHLDQTGWIDGPWSWNLAPDHQPPGSEYRFLDYGLFGGFTINSCTLSF